MKIKSDFVTNSSTTSFIFLGYHVLETKEIKEFINSYSGNFYVGGVDEGSNDGHVLLGSKLMDISDYGDISAINIDSLESQILKIEKEFGEKLNLRRSDISLIGTMRMS